MLDISTGMDGNSYNGDKASLKHFILPGYSKIC